MAIFVKKLGCDANKSIFQLNLEFDPEDFTKFLSFVVINKEDEVCKSLYKQFNYLTNGTLERNIQDEEDSLF